MENLDVVVVQNIGHVQEVGLFCRRPGAVIGSGVAKGWTGVDMSTPLLLEVAPEIDTNPTSFYRGKGRGVAPPQTPVIDSRSSLAVSVHPTYFDLATPLTSRPKYLGGAWRLPFPHFPSPPFPLPLPRPPLRSRTVKLARGSRGALVAPPAGSGLEPQRKSNFVHLILKV